MFNDVGADPASFERYIRDMVAACERETRDVPDYDIDVRREPNLLAPFDRIVVATDAVATRSAPGRLPWALLESGAGRWPIDVAAS